MNHFQASLIRQQAFHAYDQARYEQALQLGAQAVKAFRHDGMLHMMLGSSARALGRFELAADHLGKAIAQLPKDPLAHLEAARLKFSLGRFDQAIQALDKALKLRPGFPAALAVKAGVLEHRGDYAAARALLQPHVDAGTDDETMAVVYCRVLLEAKEHERVIETASRHLAKTDIGVLNRVHLLDSLAKAHDALGEVDHAFAAYKAGNELQGRPFDPAEHEREVDAIIATFSRENLSRLPRARHGSELPIFIASMPRSGSTLVEQIIHAHGQAFGAGEITLMTDLVAHLPQMLDSFNTYPACAADLTQRHVDSLADSHLRALAKLGGRAIRVANKALDNYLHLGMVQLLLPKSRVIHITRDPMDNCFSCYTAALNFPWSTRLTDIAAAYRQCERLMSHWKDVLDVPILSIRYEDLVAETEGGIRRIIDFCGLPWDENCLRYWEAERSVMTLSYDQVRKPIYKTAVRRHERYASHLEPLRQALSW